METQHTANGRCRVPECPARQSCLKRQQERGRGSARFCFGEVPPALAQYASSPMCRSSCVAPGLTRNLLALGLLHPPTETANPWRLSLPQAWGGSLTHTGASVLSFLSPTSAASAPAPPAIRAGNISLQPPTRECAGGRVTMLLDTDMQLPLPQKSPNAEVSAEASSCCGDANMCKCTQ